MSEYKSIFPEPPSRAVLSRLGAPQGREAHGDGAKDMVGGPLFSESFISSTEQVALLRARSIVGGHRGPLLTCFLWVILGRLYLQQYQQTITADGPDDQQRHRLLPLAELCAHEALLTSELCSEVYVLKGESLLLGAGESSSQEASALEAFRLALQMGSSRGEALRGMAWVYSRDAGNERTRLLLALQAAQEAAHEDVYDTAALTLMADVCRRLNMDKLGDESFSRALQLEETDPIIPWSGVVDLFYAHLN